MLTHTCGGLAGFVRVLYTSLHVRAVMSVMSAKQPGIFPHVREHLVSDKASHIFKHLENSELCRALCSVDCFHILDLLTLCKSIN